MTTCMLIAAFSTVSVMTRGRESSASVLQKSTYFKVVIGILILCGYEKEPRTGIVSHVPGYY